MFTFVNVEIKQKNELLKLLKEINKEGKQRNQQINELHNTIVEYNENMMKCFREQNDKYFQIVTFQSKENMKRLDLVLDILNKYT